MKDCNNCLYYGDCAEDEVCEYYVESSEDIDFDELKNEYYADYLDYLNEFYTSI